MPKRPQVAQKLLLTHLVRHPAPSASAAAGAGGGGASPPLLILFHGVGANEQQMASVAPAFDPRLLVVSARSPIVLGPGSYAWFHVAFAASGPVIDAKEAKQGWCTLARFIDEATAAYGADPSRVYVGGFSQGGIISLAATLTSPGKIAGAMCMSGRLLPAAIPYAAPRDQLRGKPVAIVHGTQDTKLAIPYGRTAREKLEELGLDVAYREFDMAHTMTDESLAFVSGWLSARLDAPVAV